MFRNLCIICFDSVYCKHLKNILRKLQVWLAIKKGSLIPKQNAKNQLALADVATLYWWKKGVVREDHKDTINEGCIIGQR